MLFWCWLCATSLPLSVKGNDLGETGRSSAHGLPGSSVHHHRRDARRRFVTAQQPPKVHAHSDESQRLRHTQENERAKVWIYGSTLFMRELRKHTERRRNKINDIDGPAVPRRRDDSEVLLPFRVEGPSTKRPQQEGQQRQGSPVLRKRGGDDGRVEKPAMTRQLPISRFERMDLSAINASVISAAHATRTDSNAHPDVEHAVGYYGKYQSLVTVGKPQKARP